MNVGRDSRGERTKRKSKSHLILLAEIFDIESNSTVQVQFTAIRLHTFALVYFILI